MVVGSPIVLNLIPGGVMPVIMINETDKGYQKEFLIYNGNAPYNVPSNVSATIRGTKRDGYGVTEAADVTAGSNVVRITVTEQMTAVPGKNIFELVFVDTNGLRVATANFIMLVERSALNANTVISESDIAYAEQVLTQLQGVAAFKEQLDNQEIAKIQRYDTVAQMQADTDLKAGMYARTGGYSALDDGGTGLYKIRAKNGSEATDAYNVIQMSDASLVAQLITSRTAVTNFKEFVDAINDGNQNSSYHCTEITIESTITLTSNNQCSGKSFSGATFTLNADMFQWSTMSSYHAIPSFTNCVFIGNGHSICKDGAYALGAKFVNCTFINCSIVKNGAFLQSFRFVNCEISNAAAYTFIHAERVYDTKFISCRVEADNKAPLVNAYNTTANRVSVSKLSFEACIIEGQTSKVVIMHDGSVAVYDLYSEDLADSFIQVLPSAGYNLLMLEISASRMGPRAGVDFISVDSSYFGKIYTRVSIKDSSIALGNLINSDLFRFYNVEHIVVTSGGTILPSKERADLGESHKNLVADLSNAAAGTMVVKKFPALVSFDSSIGGWHTNLYLVSLGTNNTPNVKCISDPTKTPTAAYDSETGYVTVTMHESSSSTRNRSAIWLPGVINDYNKYNYWQKNGQSGYQA